MINLVLNELYKVFHKKGIYIVLIITLLFGIITNYIYSIDTLNTNFLETEYKYNKEYVDEVEKSGEEKDDDYITSKIEVEKYDYANEFGKNSWQKIVLLNGSNYSARLHDIMTKIIYYKVGRDRDNAAYQKALDDKNNLTEELKSMSSNDYAKTQKKLIEDNLEIEEKGNNDKDLVASFKAQLETIDLRIKYDIPYAFDEFNTYLNNYEENRMTELSYLAKDEKKLRNEEKNSLKKAHADAEVYKYKIENHVKEVKNNSFNAILDNFYDEYFIMILVIIIIVAGTIVSEEFSKGTIKLLLVRPYSRIKILLSKFIVSIIMVLLAIGFTFVIQMILGIIFFDIDTLSIPAVIYNYNTNMIEHINIFKLFLYETIAILPQLILIATIAFTLSTVFINSALANTITIIGVFGSNIINLLASQYEVDILKYFITLNWDFTPYLFGNSSPYIGVTLPLSIIVCIIYFVILLVISCIVFKRRNIKNI